jgi:hypothetical protein
MFSDQLKLSGSDLYFPWTKTVIYTTETTFETDYEDMHEDMRMTAAWSCCTLNCGLSMAPT